MEVELDPRHKVLTFKVRAVSRESQPHKAVHVLDADLRNHWSTSTNAKEWLLLELEEPCLLQQIRVQNKSVLEWEISVGLRYKPDTFLKVRSRCEAPRREFQCITNYSPCRYLKISCLRGNPISIFSVQLIGIPMPGLEPEFQPLVDHLLPHLTSNKQEIQDLYLQLLHHIMTRLSPFLPHVEVELSGNLEGIDSTLKYFAMLSGPLYPILTVIDEREKMKNSSNVAEAEFLKGSQASIFTVSSNFQAPPRRSRSPVPSQHSAHTLAFRPDAALLLLKVAYKDSNVGTVCKMVARVLEKLNAPASTVDLNSVPNESATATGSQNMISNNDGSASTEAPASSFSQTDYSLLFGEDFWVPDDNGRDSVGMTLLDIALLEEGLLHILYACVSQPLLCRRLADMKPNLMPVLPFLQTILPALRPASYTDQVDENFTPWQTSMIQRAFSQVVSLSTSPLYRPLLDVCAGYLLSFSPAHEKAACVIIDLCCGPLAPWMPMVVAKVDLVFELVEELLGTIQMINQGVDRARAALIYIMLGLSGHMDEALAMYKRAKHNVLFLIEILEPFLVPATTPVQNTIAFGDVSAVLTENQEFSCSLALDIIRTSIKKPTILPALESEWRRGHVLPSVLLAILAPNLPLPPGIDAYKGVKEKIGGSTHSAARHAATDTTFLNINQGIPKTLVSEQEIVAKPDALPSETLEDGSLFFVPAELKAVKWKQLNPSPDNQGFGQLDVRGEPKAFGDRKDKIASEPLTVELGHMDMYFHLEAEYLQLVTYHEREARAAEFIQIAMELHNQDANVDNQLAAVDALLLAAECHLNPFFMLHSTEYEHLLDRVKKAKTARLAFQISSGPGSLHEREAERGLFGLEEERDMAVLQILLKAAQWDHEILRRADGHNLVPEDPFAVEGIVDSHIIAFDVDENCKVDAITFVRNHEHLLSKFLFSHLQKHREEMYEVLLQGVLFLLYSATQLSCSPELVVDTLLKIAERLNLSLIFNHTQIKEGKINQASPTMYRIYRQWALLDRLLVAAIGGGSLDQNGELGHSGPIHYTDLVPASAWMARIMDFAASPFPLVRYVGWKGVACFSKCQKETAVLLASDLHQLSFLLLIFGDEMASSEILMRNKRRAKDLLKSFSQTQLKEMSSDLMEQSDNGSAISVLYPELDIIFPNLGQQFQLISQHVLEAICFQLKSLPASAIPDVLCWFSELCSKPFLKVDQGMLNHPRFRSEVKGYVAANMKLVILRLLEVILEEHLEAIIPELPRVISVLLSLCQSSYSDVSLLDSVLKALKPVISYGIASARASEQQIEDNAGGLTFESLCFDSLMDQLKRGPGTKSENGGRASQGALLLYLAGFVLSDLSTARRTELMQLLIRWVNFTSYSPTTSYYDYLCAFQKILEALVMLVEQALGVHGYSLEKGLITPKNVMVEKIEEPVLPPNLYDKDEGLQSVSVHPSLQEMQNENLISEVNGHTSVSFPMDDLDSKDEGHIVSFKRSEPQLFANQSELEEFEKCVKDLVSTLGLSLETVWSLHTQFVEDVSSVAAKCLMLTSLLSSICSGSVASMQREVDMISSGFGDTSLESLAEAVMTFQKYKCWQVVACKMNFLLSLPVSFQFSKILSSLSTILQFQSTQAPRLALRLLTVKWLFKIITRTKPGNLSSSPLVQLFKVLLEHKEPELRAGALEQLANLVEKESPLTVTERVMNSPITDTCIKRNWSWLTCREKQSDMESISTIVVGTWDKVSSLAACDPSSRIRRQALELLMKLIPSVQPHHLTQFLSSIDTILPGLAKSAFTLRDASITRLSLALLARACLYASVSDLCAIPSRVWNSLEILSKSKPGSILAETEQTVCIALLQLRENCEDGKQSVWNALSRGVDEPELPRPEILRIRETVLEVLSRLHAARTMEDNLMDAALNTEKELEAAEIELDIVRKQTSKEGDQRWGAGLGSNKPVVSSEIPSKNVQERLEELRTQIRAEDHAALRAEIIARRERQKLAYRDRQLALEEATLREIELLQELDREKAAELEHEIERHRIIERERAKTKELKHNLDLDTERRAQRELQRELEQRESGIIRPSRREFSGSTSSSRPRERYRERESGRSGQESRSSSTGVTRENSTTPPATPTAGASLSVSSSLPSIVIASSSSRAYPSQSLALPLGRDRLEDRGYDEALDAVALNSEGSSYGDMDMGTPEAGGNGLNRPGARGSRPRQIIERRERERREGKWERKQM